MEPSINELLKLREFNEGLRGLNEEELRTLCSQLAELALVGYPSSIRWLMREMHTRRDDGARWYAMAEELRSGKEKGEHCSPSARPDDHQPAAETSESS